MQLQVHTMQKQNQQWSLNIINVVHATHAKAASLKTVAKKIQLSTTLEEIATECHVQQSDM